MTPRALVTGSGGGIGGALVSGLGTAGWDVVEADLPEFDVRDPEAVERGVSAAGSLDAVVANAGVVDTIHRAERFSEEEWQKDVDTNLSGAFRVLRAAFPALEQSGGSAVVISSASAETGLPGQVAYTAAKAGLVGMARTLAAEWGPRGVRVNVVMPGMIATPKVKALPDEMQERIAGALPLRRIGEPADIANAVEFLLSERAAYVTGTVLRVDGGYGLAGAALA